MARHDEPHWSGCQCAECQPQPSIYPVDAVRAAYQRGLAAGRAEVLRDVAKAETPYVLVIASDETEGARCVFCHCVHRLGLADIKHHDGCIWVQAQAAQESSHA